MFHCFLLFLSSVYSATIAVGYVFGSRSHVVPYFDSLSMLAESGHDVYFVAMEKDLRFTLDYPLIKTAALNINATGMHNKILENMINSTSTDLRAMMDVLDLVYSNYEEQYKEFYRVSNELNVDYWLCDFFAGSCEDAAIQNNLDYGVIGGIGTMGYQEVWYAPSMINACSLKDWIDSPWIRFKALFKTLLAIPRIRQSENALSKVREDLGITISLKEKRRLLGRRLYFAHGIFGIIPSRPLPPNVYVLGPLWPRKIPALSNEVQQILDDCYSKGQSVIYIAFGSIAAGYDFVMQKITHAAKLLLEENPDAVILWSTTSTNAEMGIIKAADRMIIKKWVRQKAVLLHPAVKMFVTHAGRSSMHEAVYAGKPMIALPLFADQFYNSIQLQDIGIAKFVKKMEFTPESLKEDIQQVLTDIRDPDSLLSRNVAKYQKIGRLNSEIHHPLVANLVELAAVVGVDHLVPITETMSFSQKNPPIYLLFVFMVIWISTKLFDWGIGRFVEFLKTYLKKSASSKLKSS